MLDFGSLKYTFAENQETEKTYSFVGIKNQNGLKNLFLPLGFKSKSLELDDSYSTKKELFFLLYRALRKYTGRLKQYNKDWKQSANDRDGAGEGATTNTFSIDTDEGTEEIVYTRFSGLDDVLDGYDELRLFAMRERMRRSDKIDYSNIHRYLDKAVYLPDDTIFIDEVETPKPTLGRHTTDLVRMYCYIYSEIKREMDESDDISPEVAVEAENFQEEHLSPNDSLFDEESNTGDKLREQLERIDEQTAFKDDAYWHFYEAIEAVLYPQKRINNNDNDIHWGINNFCFVWEDMCQEKLAADMDFNVLYADRIDGIIGSEKDDIQPALNLTTSTSEKVSLKPDAITSFSGGFIRDNFEFRRHDWNDYGQYYAAIQCLAISSLEDGGYKKSWFGSRGSDELKFGCWSSNTKNNYLQIKCTATDTPGEAIDKQVYKLLKYEGAEKLFLGLTWIPNIGGKGHLSLSCLIDASGSSNPYKDERLDSLKHPTSWLCIMAMRSFDVWDIGIKRYFRLIDFKYKKSPSDDDCRKQLVYDLALRKGFNAAVQNVLVMPSEETKEAGTLEMDDPYQGIWLVTWNARETIESYIGRHQA